MIERYRFAGRFSSGSVTAPPSSYVGSPARPHSDSRNKKAPACVRPSSSLPSGRGKFTFTFTWRPARCASCACTYPARAQLDAHASSARVCCTPLRRFFFSARSGRGKFYYFYMAHTATRISWRVPFRVCTARTRMPRSYHLRACACLRPPRAHARARRHTRRAHSTHTHTTAHTGARTAHYTRDAHRRTRTQAHGHTSARVVVTAVVTSAAMKIP